jgi:hypothetical protein
MPFALEIYGPGGYLLHRESLYDFLCGLYHGNWPCPPEYLFEELDILVNGMPLLPRTRGRA